MDGDQRRMVTRQYARQQGINVTQPEATHQVQQQLAMVPSQSQRQHKLQESDQSSHTTITQDPVVLRPPQVFSHNQILGQNHGLVDMSGQLDALERGDSLLRGDDRLNSAENEPHDLTKRKTAQARVNGENAQEINMEGNKKQRDFGIGNPVATSTPVNVMQFVNESRVYYPGTGRRDGYEMAGDRADAQHLTFAQPPVLHAVTPNANFAFPSPQMSNIPPRFEPQQPYVVTYQHPQPFAAQP